MSAIVAVFDVRGMTSEQYDQVNRELEDAGLGSPRGRLYHVAASTSDGWFVTDVWESGEHLDSFGETLVPILQNNGVTPVEPQIYPVHNIIT